MVAFSRITFALAVAGLSSAQSFSGPAPSGAFPSGAARPTGGFGGHGHGGHGGHGTAPTVAPSSALERRQQPSGTPPAFSGGFPAPSGGFPSGGFPESGAPFPTGAFSGFPSGIAHPSGHHGHGKGGKGGKGGSHSGPAPTASGLKRRQQPSGTPPAFSGSFPAPSGGFPSGGFPESGAPFPTGAFSGFPSGVAHPSGHHGHHGHGGKPSGKPSGPAPTGFVTSTVRGA